MLGIYNLSIPSVWMFAQVVEDYETPPQSELRRDLESRMQSYMDYLDHCRPTSVSMANAMRDLKNKLQQIPSSISDKEVIFIIKK
jgi:translation initiation factor 2B subunit (eIF-2B alpha/beta/delta family)